MLGHCYLQANVLRSVQVAAVREITLTIHSFALSMLAICRAMGTNAGDIHPGIMHGYTVSKAGCTLAKRHCASDFGQGLSTPPAICVGGTLLKAY